VADAPNVLGAALDAVLAWLRVPTWTATLSRAELVFSPFVVAAFLFHLRNSVVMLRLWRRLRADEELRASARERLLRAVRGMLRLLCWIGIVWALAVNWQYATVVFTVGILVYGIIEAVDAGLDWVYQYQRARYWERRDAMEDYAQQVAALARTAAERAERAASVAVQQGQRLEEKLDQTLVLAEGAREGGAHTGAAADDIKVLVVENTEVSRNAFHEANGAKELIAKMQEQIDALIKHLDIRLDRSERDDRREVQEGTADAERGGEEAGR
jgi:hypothetical protein